MSQLDTQITIVGAGPAGSTLSAFLSKAKVQHVIIDKAVFPRDKVCGDALTLEALSTLKKLDEQLYQKVIAHTHTAPSEGCKIIDEKGRTYAAELKNKVPGSSFYVIPRFTFDNILFEHINPEYANVFTNSKITSLEKSKGKVNVVFEQEGKVINVESDLIIACDGERSVVKKTFHKDGIKKDRENYWAGVRAYYEGVEGLSEFKELEFFFFDKYLPGYFWVFPSKKGNTNVGLIVLSKDVSERKINIRKEFNNLIANHPLLSKRFENSNLIGKVEGWGIPISTKQEKLFGDNYLLLGDAASVAEPSTGKGIGIAMLTADAAHETILKAISKNDFSESSLKEYQDTIERRFRKEWDANGKIHKLLAKKWFVRILIPLLKFPLIDRKLKKTIAGLYNKFLKD